MKSIRSFIRGDKIIWMVLLLLCIISLIEVSSSIGKYAYDRNTSTIFLAFKHFGIICATFVVSVIVSHINHRKFAQLSIPGYYISVILLVVALILYITNSSDKAAGRWLPIPIIGQFQPSEIAKFILVVYVAHLLAKSQEKIKELDTFKQILLPIIVVSGLILPQNLSTAGLVFVSCFVMMFLGNVNKKYWSIIAGTGVVAFIIGLTILTVTYRTNDLQNEDSIFRTTTWGGRISEWLSTEYENDTQANIARRAIAIGGLTGNHPGSTVQGRLLSESHNDFIYAIIIEELGSIGGILVLLLYTALFYRCVVIASKSTTLFKALTVSGIGFTIYLQALINMGVAVGVLPVTGQTLPFISYGGTSYMISGCAIGIIQSIANSNKVARDNMKAQEENNNEEDNNKNQ